MSHVLRKSMGVLGVALSWGLVWAASFIVMGWIIGLLRPQDVAPGESGSIVFRTGWLVGVVSGAVFGALLALTQWRKQLEELCLCRVVVLSAIASAVWPLATPVDNSMLFLLCPFGAFCGLALVFIAQKTGTSILARPLQAILSGETAR